LWAVLAVASIWTVVESWGGRASIVQSQVSAVDLLRLEHFLGLLGILSRDEVGVGETSWLTTPSVDGDSDVQNVLALAEEVAEVLVGHLERKVANEESLARWVPRLVADRVVGLAADVVLDDHTATLEHLLVKALNRSGGRVEVVKFNVTKSGSN